MSSASKVYSPRIHTDKATEKYPDPGDLITMNIPTTVLRPASETQSGGHFGSTAAGLANQNPPHPTTTATAEVQRLALNPAMRLSVLGDGGEKTSSRRALHSIRRKRVGSQPSSASQLRHQRDGSAATVVCTPGEREWGEGGVRMEKISVKGSDGFGLSPHVITPPPVFNQSRFLDMLPNPSDPGGWLDGWSSQASKEAIVSSYQSALKKQVPVLHSSLLNHGVMPLLPQILLRDPINAGVPELPRSQISPRELLSRPCELGM
jgi:hypothetical protein